MQRIAQGFFGDRHGNGVCERIVDDQVYDPAGSISPGVTVNMSVCPIEMPTVIYGSPHQPVPEQNGKVIGTGQKGAVFQKTVVGGSQCVMEDDPVGDGTISQITAFVSRIALSILSIITISFNLIKTSYN